MNPAAETAIPHLVDDLDSAIDAAAEPMARRAVPQELLTKATISDLLGMACFEWAVILASWVVLAIAPWPAQVLAILVIAGRFHALGVILHDAAHMPLREHTWGVRALEVMAGFHMATTLAAMRYHHIRHHRDSGMATDPYYKGKLVGRPFKYAANVLRGMFLIPVWTLRAPIGLLSLVIPSWRNLYGHLFLQDKTSKDLTHSPEVIACARAEFFQLVFQSLIVVALVFWPRAVLFGYIIPISITGVVAAWRLLREHNYWRTEDRKMETIVATTNDQWLDIWGILLMAPRNIGYHVVHHLHPQASLRVLPALRQWYIDNTRYTEIMCNAPKG